MKCLSTAVVAFALANLAFASPLAVKAATRRFTTRRTHGSVNMRNTTSSIPGSADDESSNWSGAALVTTDVTEVVGTFTVPTPRPPTDSSSKDEYCGAAWVGIDGDTCQTGLIQTGVFWCVEDGEYSYEAYVTVNAGDVITVKVTKTGTYSGYTYFENTSSDESDSHHFDDDTSGTLCGENAEWIVEDFESGSSLVPFADFGTVVFTGATAIVGGETVTASGASNLYIDQGNGALTDTTIDGDTVTVKYI